MSSIQKNGSFQYTYSASQQEEIRRIRSKYLSKEENKLERLKKLDEAVIQKATMWSLIVGIIGALILGGGLSMCLILGGIWMVAGVGLSVMGMAALGCAYPIYNRVVKNERERVAPEVIRLADELMK